MKWHLLVAVALLGLAAPLAAQAQVQGSTASPDAGRQFLQNQNSQLTAAVANLLDENAKLRKEADDLRKRAETAEAELAKLKVDKKK